MQTLKLLANILENLERTNKNFFWGDQDQKMSINSIAWSTISQHKIVGNLGIKNLKVMNKALLAKLTWRFATKQKKLWVKILYSKYGSPFQKRKTLARVSYIWRSIIIGMNAILEAANRDSA